MSTCLDNNEVKPSPTSASPAGRHHRPFDSDEAPPTPATSHLSTPKMSQHSARSVILETPPLILNAFSSPTPHLQSAPSFHSDHTPTYPEDDNDQYHFDPLEPPAWRPPEQDELEYVESWNYAHNNPRHYLSGYSYNVKDDSSTICSSQTGNNSLGKSYSSRDTRSQHMQTLRPRGFSVTSNSHGSHSNKGHSHIRHLSSGSCPQQPMPRGGLSHHHRHDSLPVALFSSSTFAQSSQPLMQSQHTQNPDDTHQHHPLLQQQSRDKDQQQSQTRINQRTYQMIQHGKRNGPYEVHSRQHASQIRADATMAGLYGVLIDLYAIDRCVDEATARMLATSNTNEVGKKNRGKEGEETKPSRMTSVGTLNDVQTILELHKVDRMVDRFKQGLQMPVFFEEEAIDIAIFKELRRVDLLIEGCHRKNDKDVTNTINRENGRNKGYSAKHKQYQFDLSDDEDEEESWDQLGGGHCDDIYFSTDSYGTAPAEDPYHFYDPHEVAAMVSNTYDQSYALATSHDDLHEIIDLLQSDVEIDGASRRQKDLEMVRPLLEIDRSMDRLRDRMEKKKCQKDLLDLYKVDLEVDGAKRRVGSRTINTDRVVPNAINSEKIMTEENCEVGFESSQIISSVEEDYVVLSSESCSDMSMPVQNIAEQTHLPFSDPPKDLQSPSPVTLECTKRSIFPHREQLSAGMVAAATNTTSAQATASSKRSIFTEKEKTVALERSFQAQGG
ncbi:hypothetical protein ACHAW6_002364 [Cyclotella cf. meneghiniana]